TTAWTTPRTDLRHNFQPGKTAAPTFSKKSENDGFLHPKRLRQKTIFRAGILHPRFGKLHDPPPKESLP
ncbi:hypothetical protein, partial [Alistipes ihumii]